MFSFLPSLPRKPTTRAALSQPLVPKQDAADGSRAENRGSSDDVAGRHTLLNHASECPKAKRKRLAKEAVEESRRVKDENDALKAENRRLSEGMAEENRRLKDDLDGLRAENKRLSEAAAEESRRFKDELDALRVQGEEAESDRPSEEVAEESRRLRDENDDLRAQSGRLSQENDGLKAENRRLSEEAEARRLYEEAVKENHGLEAETRRLYVKAVEENERLKAELSRKTTQLQRGPCLPLCTASSDCELGARPHLGDDQREIKRVRNKLYAEGGTVMFRCILFPMLEHGSAGIYAPDEIILKVYRKLLSKMSSRSEGGQGSRAGIVPWMSKGIRENAVFCLVVLASGAAFMVYGKMLVGFFETTFLGWALHNQTLSRWQRYISISAMMIVRLLVSNLLPFTSPAFAFLIQTSLPEGEEWMGTFYLLACSMPAGLVVPVCDKLLYLLCKPFRSEMQQQFDERHHEHQLDQYDHHFQATLMFARVTDHLPFSFWVRPVFMEPAFKMIKEGLGAEDQKAAAGAVLAGHFMIWAGPATTMYQRLFVPDWTTCVLIQPLGLMEDVAVVLATWAGSSPAHEKLAELCLYSFMLCMNAVQLAATFVQHGKPGRKRLAQHAIVLLLTLVAMRLRLSVEDGPVSLIVSAAAPQQAAGASVSSGPAAHTSFKIAGVLLVWATFLAVAFRLVARAVTHGCR